MKKDFAKHLVGYKSLFWFCFVNQHLYTKLSLVLFNQHICVVSDIIACAAVDEGWTKWKMSCGNETL